MTLQTHHWWERSLKVHPQCPPQCACGCEPVADLFTDSMIFSSVMYVVVVVVGMMFFIFVVVGMMIFEALSVMYVVVRCLMYVVVLMICTFICGMQISDPSQQPD